MRLSFYENNPTKTHGERLLTVLLQEQAKLTTQQDEAQRQHQQVQTQAELTTQDRTSLSFSNLWYWISHRVQDFFGSSPKALAEHYATIAKQREQDLSQLNRGIALLRQEIERLDRALEHEHVSSTQTSSIQSP